MGNQGPFASLDQILNALDWKLEQHPTYPDVLNMRALARAQAGNLEGARDDLVDALRLNPKFEAALINLAWLHVLRDEPGAFRAIRQGRQAQALDAARRRHLDTLEALQWRGPAAALTELDAVPENERGDWWALDRLLAAVRAQSWDVLQQQLALLFTAKPALAPHFERLGLVQKGQVQRGAWGVWGNVYCGNPLTSRLLVRLHDLMPLEAGADLLKLALDWSVAISLDVCEYWLARGADYEQRLEDEEAETAYKNAGEDDPQRAEPHIALGMLYAAQGRGGEATAELEAAAALRPWYAKVRYLLGLLYEDNGRLDRAEAEYRQALQSNPKYVMATLSLGNVLAMVRKDQEAVSLLERVREAGVESADVEATLATLYERLGHREQARRARQRALEVSRQLAWNGDEE